MGNDQTTEASAIGDRTSVSRPQAALAGLAAAIAALGASELVAGLFADVPSLLLAIGDAVIDIMPGSFDRKAIDLFGTSDKSALIIGTVIIALALGAVLGIVARRWFVPAAAGFVLFAVLGVSAALAKARTPAIGAVIVGVIGAATGVAVLRGLLTVATPRSRAREPGGGPDRRKFLIWSGGTLVAGALAGLGGWALSGRQRVEEIRRAIRLPRPTRSPRPVPGATKLDVDGITPLFTPNGDFYRVDTALRTPAVDPDHWHLEIRGAVDRPYSLTYQELLDLPQVEADITLACVSNEVGGNLVGNARWQGVPLQHLLQRAGVQPAGKQVMGHSVDGFTAGFPTAMALDDGDAMVAVAMNGQPLPINHGFPARIIVPGLYGYVSATKWLRTIELTGWDAQGYWVPRGWSQRGPIKTESRIDVPRPASTIAAGHTVIAGVAWAPTRGIERVEVRVDDGALAGRELGRSPRRGQLATVVPALEGRTGRSHDHRPCHRWHRHDPDRRDRLRRRRMALPAIPSSRSASTGSDRRRSTRCGTDRRQAEFGQPYRAALVDRAVRRNAHRHRPEPFVDGHLGRRIVADRIGETFEFDIRGTMVGAQVPDLGVVTDRSGFHRPVRATAADDQLGLGASGDLGETRDVRFDLAGVADDASFLFPPGPFGEHAQIQHRPDPARIVDDHECIVEDVRASAVVDLVEMVHVLTAAREHPLGPFADHQVHQIEEVAALLDQRATGVRAEAVPVARPWPGTDSGAHGSPPCAGARPCRPAPRAAVHPPRGSSGTRGPSTPARHVAAAAASTSSASSTRRAQRLLDEHISPVPQQSSRIVAVGVVR